MTRAFGKRRSALPTGLIVAVAVGSLLAVTTRGASAGPHKAANGSRHAAASNGQIPRNALKLIVGGPAGVHPIRSGFLGLSIEYPSIEPYAGTDPNQINPVLVQLIRNITPNQSPVLRIGGDSTDWMWWPVAHVRKPGGVRYALTPRWMAVTKALSEQLHARLIPGLDLEVNNLTLERVEARALLDGLGRRSIDALEPGNEPELYGSWAWYVSPDGTRVHGRPASWDIAAYAREFSTLHQTLKPTPLAGPASGSPKWSAELGQFLGTAPYLKLVTVHRYPLQLCYTAPSDPKYPTIQNLLSAQASRGLATATKADILLAHAHGMPIRIAEMNTNSCGDASRVTKTFASALWAIDTLFAMANAGADGVNVHTYKGSSYQLFTFDRAGGQWSARVEPEYYGLDFFAQAAPPGSKLLRLYGPANSALRAWATRGLDGKLRITLINDDLHHARTVAIKAPGKATTPATLIRLTAPGAAASGGISFGGLTFGARTTTGQPAGAQQAYAEKPTKGEYVVRVPPASAALLIR
jgi:hypothetical protein